VRNKLKHGCMTLPEKDEGNASNNMDMSHQNHNKMVAPDTLRLPHNMNLLPIKKQIIIIALTFALLFLAIFITLYFIPMSSMPMGTK
jgi:hypothetical protein